jgi:hypothetical protein
MSETTRVLFTLESDSPLVGTIAFVKDKVVKHNQGKFSNLARYSKEGFIEYLLELGITACDNAVDADVKRRNEAAYVSAMAKLDAPSDPNDTDAMQVYFRRIASLKQKFGIGGTATEV